MIWVTRKREDANPVVKDSLVICRREATGLSLVGELLGTPVPRVSKPTRIAGGDHAPACGTSPFPLAITEKRPDNSKPSVEIGGICTWGGRAAESRGFALEGNCTLKYYYALWMQ